MTAITRQEFPRNPAAAWRLTFGMLMLAAAVLAASSACMGDAAGTAAAEPWGTNTVTPAEFAKEIGGSGTAKPVIVCTAPPFLYRQGHIPGAVHHGPMSASEGLASLTAWAQTLRRDVDLVLYCGCCPMNVCPNIRPAYTALKGLGFTKVRVLILPDSFRADWAERGYPVER